MTQKLLSYLSTPKKLLPGNTCEILRDGREAYPSMLAAIGQAKRTINLETYIIASDRTGWVFARALAERARAGVEVNFLFDAIGGWECTPEFLSFLKEAGVRVVEFHPIAPWRPRWGWNARDHRKILVVDGEVGFTGGINISDDYAPYEEGGGGWRDTHCKVTGPAVRELNRLFLNIWRRSNGPPLDLKKHLLDIKPTGDVPALVLDTTSFRNRSAIRRAYLHALKRARRAILITSAYFIPDRGFMRAFKNARKRGVDVQIMVPRDSDVLIVWYASRALYQKLLSWGVKIFEWKENMLHAKTAVIDGVWSTIGSCNMDHRSFRLNQEANLVFLDEGVGREMVAMFEEDKKFCQPVLLPEFERRPFFQKLLEKICYFFRYWL